MRHFIVSFDVWECKKMGITLVGFEVLMVTDLFGSLIAWFIRMTRNMIQLNFESSVYLYVYSLKATKNK